MTSKPFLQSEERLASVSLHLYTVEIYTTHTLAFPLMQSFCLLVCRPTLRLKVSTNSTTKASFPVKLGFMIGRNGLKASYLISGEYNSIWTAWVVLVKVYFNDNNIVWMHMPLYNNSKGTNIYLSMGNIKRWCNNDNNDNNMLEQRINLIHFSSNDCKSNTWKRIGVGSYKSQRLERVWVKLILKVNYVFIDSSEVVFHIIRAFWQYGCHHKIKTTASARQQAEYITGYELQTNTF